MFLFVLFHIFTDMFWGLLGVFLWHFLLCFCNAYNTAVQDKEQLRSQAKTFLKGVKWYWYGSHTWTMIKWSYSHVHLIDLGGDDWQTSVPPPTEERSTIRRWLAINNSENFSYLPFVILIFHYIYMNIFVIVVLCYWSIVLLCQYYYQFVQFRLNTMYIFL